MVSNFLLLSSDDNVVSSTVIALKECNADIAKLCNCFG